MIWTILVIGQIEWYFVLIDASKPKYSIYIYSICVDFSITRFANFKLVKKCSLKPWHKTLILFILKVEFTKK